MTTRAAFGASTTADEVLQGLDLTGLRVLITGASGGLGAETARALAAKGARVMVTARNRDKMQSVASALRSSTGADLEVYALELGSFASIRACAERFLAEHDTLDVLINNAGIMACPHGVTEDGFELQFGANHLGHFLLTNLIADTLVQGARVVSLSSLAHQFSPVVFDDIEFEERAYDKWSAYGQSKTANALFAVALQARLAGRGVEAFSVHPGTIETDLARHRTDEDRARASAARAAGRVTYKSIAAGAATTVFAATAPELLGKGGAYLSDCSIAAVSATDNGSAVVRPYALDPSAAERLWAVSEQMLGQRFDY